MSAPDARGLPRSIRYRERRGRLAAGRGLATQRAGLGSFPSCGKTLARVRQAAERRGYPVVVARGAKPTDRARYDHREGGGGTVRSSRTDRDRPGSGLPALLPVTRERDLSNEPLALRLVGK